MISKDHDAPDFTLEQHDGTSFTLSSEVKHGPLVLFFYPRDFTPVCTAQACMFRDMHEELARAGVRVFGVSPQTREEHVQFRSAYGLTYALLSDPKREVIGLYAESILGIRTPWVTRRVTYLIDRGMRVRERIIADLSAAAHERIKGAAQSIARDS